MYLVEFPVLHVLAQYKKMSFLLALQVSVPLVFLSP